MKFPPQVDHLEFLDLVRKMLQKKVNNRLHRLEDIKEHPFFVNANFEWEALENMSIKPPFIPNLNKTTTKSADVIPLSDYLKKSLDDYKKNYPKRDKSLPKILYNQWDEDF